MFSNHPSNKRQMGNMDNVPISRDDPSKGIVGGLEPSHFTAKYVHKRNIEVDGNICSCKHQILVSMVWRKTDILLSGFKSWELLCSSSISFQLFPGYESWEQLCWSVLYFINSISYCAYFCLEILNIKIST